jgi:DNA repair exonuclease SbcCD nuclease subunit
MEKAIVTSDLHIHFYKQFNENGRRLKNGIDYLDYIFRLAHANEIKYILFPGDLMNNMQIIATKVVNAIAECLKRNFTDHPEIKIIAVSGNHDYSERNLLDNPAESALRHLEILFPENFILLDYPYDHETWFVTENNHTIVGIPYYEHSEHFRKTLEKVNEEIFPFKSGEKTYLLMHQTVASGLPIEDTIEATDPLFDGFDFVFNGHIHEAQEVTDKFINVGSPMNRDAGDIGKAKGFWVVDLDDPQETISFKDITDKYPRFIHKTIGEELTEEEKQQYVIWVPPVVTNETAEKEVSDKFRTDLAPKTLLANYADTVLHGKEKEEKLTYIYGLL